MVLSNQLKATLFYDYGESFSGHTKLSAAGAGLILPFGGDFIGAGTLSLAKVSFEIVLYSRINNEISAAPSVLFNIMGET